MTDQIMVQLSRLPDRLAAHVLLTVAALGIGTAISVPLAILANRLPRLRGPLLGTAGVVQTIPSLALLALMVPLLGQIGFLPAFIALVLYSMLPILRNTVTGLAQVDPGVREAAMGVGMSSPQMLLKVELPLALPVIIAGIRTSAVWVVGIATLSTPVGQASLGDYIFQGLQLRNNTAVLIGCAAAATLALTLDGLIRLLEAGVQNARRGLVSAAGAGLLLVAGIAAIPLMKSPVGAHVGAKSFTEQYIVAEIVGNQLREQGFTAKVTRGMGSSILFESLVNGNIDVYVDYTGTIWANVMKRTEIEDADATYEQVKDHLKAEYGIETIGRLGFENTYALAMRRDDAARLGVRTVAELALHAPAMSIAGDYEFFGRPEWTRLQETYGLRFKDVRGMDSTLMYNAVRDDNVQVISAFSTDGRIAAYDLRVLADPQNALPPYDAVILVSRQAAAKPGFIEALRPLVGSISDERMRELNKAVDVDGRLPVNVAKE